MHITRYRASQAGSEISESYGVVNDETTHALRIHIDDYGDTTILSCRAGYRGEELAFTAEAINDPSNSYQVRDDKSRRLSVETTPPLVDPDARMLAVGALASALFAEWQPDLSKLAVIPGDLTIGLKIY